MKRATPFIPRYRLDFKLRALSTLDANDGRLYQTAKQLGIPRQTLRDWHLGRESIHREVEKLRQQRGITLSEQLEVLLHQIVDAMPDKVERARLMDAVRALSMVLDLSKSMEQQQQADSGARERLAERLERYAAAAAESDEELARLENW